MRAVTWQGPRHVSVDEVPDPAIHEATDAIIRVTSTAICWMCRRGLQSQCETTQVPEYGSGTALFGYAKLYGQVPGGQAELLRVPRADDHTIPVGSRSTTLRRCMRSFRGRRTDASRPSSSRGR